MDTFASYYNRINKPTAGGSVKVNGIIGPSVGAKNQNIIKKDKKITNQYAHSTVERFATSPHLKKLPISDEIKDILKAYDIIDVKNNEEKIINSQSNIKITNRNGEFYLER